MMNRETVNAFAVPCFEVIFRAGALVAKHIQNCVRTYYSILWTYPMLLPRLWPGQTADFRNGNLEEALPKAPENSGAQAKSLKRRAPRGLSQLVGGCHRPQQRTLHISAPGFFCAVCLPCEGPLIALPAPKLVLTGSSAILAGMSNHR